MSETVLVTGAFGLVGPATVRRLASEGRRVVATARGSRANRKAAQTLPAGVEARWADLSEPADVSRLVADVSPAVIIHLAAVIPPAIYRNAAFARKVNVDGTAGLLRAAEALPIPPRFVHASSAGVYGEYNPYRFSGLVGTDTPPNPCDVYGGHKLEAEQLVQSSNLKWVILRIGGVLSADPRDMPFDRDTVFFATVLPTDCRVHTIDTRDVAAALTAATTADVGGQTLLIGGDESHLLTQDEVAHGPAHARGLEGILVFNRPGDPDRDDNWYPNCWMDVASSQKALSYQHHSWPDMVDEMRSIVGWKWGPTRLLRPVARRYVKHVSAYRDWPGVYADPWGVIRARLGEPGLDRPPRVTDR